MCLMFIIDNNLWEVSPGVVMEFLMKERVNLIDIYNRLQAQYGQCFLYDSTLQAIISRYTVK